MRESKNKLFPNIEENYSLLDLISLNKLQLIQDAFADANQVASTIVDLNGNPITVPSNHSDVCAMIRGSELGMENCRISAKALGAKAAKNNKPLFHKCLSCGFTDAAAPIIVNGKHLAYWLIGQYYTGDVDEQRISNYSKEIGLDEKNMVNAFREMPKISKHQFEKSLNFLGILANEISDLGYRNLIWKQQNDELYRTKKQLEVHQNQLEQLVEVRTAELVELNNKLSEEIELKTSIQKKQSRLITAIENTDDTIVITDRDGRIIYVNPAFERITGYLRKEALNQNPKILKSDFHDNAFYQNLWKTILSGNTWKGRFRNRKKDRTIYDEDATISPVKDSDGNITNFVAVKRDITRELKLERQLQQAKKLESIGTLAAGISHEINTPIQYITDNTVFLADAFRDMVDFQALIINYLDDAAIQDQFTSAIDNIRCKAEEIDIDFLITESGKAIEDSLKGLDRIGTIVSAMKDFSEPGGNSKQEEDLNAIIMNVVEVSRAEWKKHTQIELDLDRNLPRVPLLSGEFKQVIMILLMNAVYAIGENICKNNMEEGVIKITTGSENKMASIAVSDTGIGIHESQIEKIFDPFFTTKPVGKGTGQGLGIAYEVIVGRHNGTLNVTSKQGVGTEFTIGLPLSL